MNKRNSIITICICFILSAAIGGFFWAKQKGFLSKRANDGQRTITELSSQQSANSSFEQVAPVQNSAESDTKAAIKSEDETAKPASQNSNLPKPSQSVGDKTDEKASQDASNSEAGKIVSKLVNFGFQKSSGRNIKAIIIHTSYNALGGDPFDFSKVMQEWKDAGVAPHYAIDRGGTIYQLVADQNIAWHAGSSKLPDGTTDVNGVSIGIEVVNSQDAKFTDDQYTALNSLIASLEKKYSIKYVLGHDDIAPGRKSDPWNIDWSRINK